MQTSPRPDAVAPTRPGALDGVSPPLTASQAFDDADIAGVLSDQAGRTITRVVVEDDEWRESAVARGMPPAAADFTLGMFRASRRGEFAVTDLTLERLLGRAPISMRTVVDGIVAAHQ